MLWSALSLPAPRHPEMPDFRVLECPAAYQLGTKTVAKPDLTTPDEFEGDDMRVVKLRSSVTTSGHTQDACELRQRRLLRFYTPQHPDTATPQEHQKRNCTPEPREQIRLREPWCPHIPFAPAASPRGRTTHIVSARVQSVCLQKIGTLRGFQTRF